MAAPLVCRARRRVRARARARARMGGRCGVRLAKRRVRDRACSILMRVLVWFQITSSKKHIPPHVVTSRVRMRCMSSRHTVGRRLRLATLRASEWPATHVGTRGAACARARARTRANAFTAACALSFCQSNETTVAAGSLARHLWRSNRVKRMLRGHPLPVTAACQWHAGGSCWHHSWPGTSWLRVSARASSRQQG